MTRNGPQRRFTADEHQQMIAWSAEGVPVKEQARRLERDYPTVCVQRRRMARMGLLRLKSPPPRRPWTKEEEYRLLSLLEEGKSYDDIARRLKRTRNAVIIKAKKRGVRLLTVGGVYTARDISLMLGIPPDHRTVTWWIRTGALVATNGGTARKPIWRIHLEDLWAFLENEQYWMAWKVEAITDPDLRDWARELRDGTPRWLTIGEVARRLFVTHASVNDYIHKGYLPSVKYGNHWIRESDLDGFVVPADWRKCSCKKRIDPRTATPFQVQHRLCATCAAQFSPLSDGTRIRIIKEAA